MLWKYQRTTVEAQPSFFIGSLFFVVHEQHDWPFCFTAAAGW